MLVSGSSPLKNMVFSVTGLQDKKPIVEQWVRDMGGVVATSFTTAVEYLVVGSRDSPKYEYVVKNCLYVKFVDAELFERIFNKWRSAEDMDFEREFAGARLLPFSHLSICITNVDEKSDLIHLIEKNGGTFAEHLQKRVNVLVSPKLKGRKVAWAQKWEIPVVTTAWINDSIERGASLSTTYYEEGSVDYGKDAWIKDSKVSARSLGTAYTVRDDSAEKLTKSSSKKASARRVGSIKEVFDVMVEAGIMHQDPRLRKLEIEEDSVWVPSRPHLAEQETRARSSSVVASPPTEYKRVFDQKEFVLLGFTNEQLKKLQSTIESNGGRVISLSAGRTATETASTTFILNSTRGQIPTQLQLDDTRSQFYTEWLLERSLYFGKYCQDMWGRYLKYRDISGFRNFKVCISGFTGVELMHVEKLIKLLGAEYCTTFSRAADILIAQSTMASKYSYAIDWQIPVLTVEWLWACGADGIIQPVMNKEWSLDGNYGVERILRPKGIHSRTIAELPEIGRGENSRKRPLLPSNSSIINDENKRVLNRNMAPIVGRASVSSLKDSNVGISTTDSSESAGIGTEEQVTSIGYFDPQTHAERNKLLKTMGEDPDEREIVEEAVPVRNYLDLNEERFRVGQRKKK